MKIALLILAASLTASAQTNFFPLLKAGGTTYTNATIRSVTAADAIVSFDGGGARVALSNLTPDLQKRFGYDPQKAKLALVKDAERRIRSQRAEAELAAINAWRGDTSLATVVSIESQIAGTPKCIITVSNSTFAVLLTGLPASIRNFFSEKAQLENDIATRSANNEREKWRLSNLEDSLPSEASSDSPAGRAIHQMNIDSKRLAQSCDQVAKMKDDLSELILKQGRLASCYVRQTAKQYAGIQIWECQ